MPEASKEQLHTPERHLIRLTGLSCADCAEKLEARLRRLPGVERADVNFGAATLVVEHHGALAPILHAVKDAGYGTEIDARASLGESIFILAGLDCPDCAASLERKLRHVAGVEEATVNFAASEAVVRHTGNPERIRQAIEAAGYGARLESGGMLSTDRRSFLATHSRMLTTILSAVLLAVAWGLSLTGFPYTIPLYLAAIGVGGYWTFRRAFSSLKHVTLDMNVLMTIAVTGAILIREWNEAALVAVLYSVSNMLESYAMEKTRHSIRGLMDLAPREALVRRDGIEQRLPIERLDIGDIVIIKPGEKVAVDGVVAAGASSINQAAITGESMPVEKGAGDEVFAGTLNEHGALEVRVTKLAGDSTLAKIIHLVEEAQASRAPAQAFIDRFAKYYTPAILALAALLAVLPPLFFLQPWAVWFYRALALVVIACPCALVISTPVAIVSAIGAAARNGVLIKGGAYLEQAGRLTLLAFDKTGTLTSGHPVVTDVIPADSVSPAQLLAMAAAVESRSAHPLAAAIMKKADDEMLVPPAVDAAVTLTGRGAQGVINGQMVYVGSPRLFDEMGAGMNGLSGQLSTLQQQGKTVMLVGTDAGVLGVIAVADRIRSESPEAIRELHRAGITAVVMLTGDHHETAGRIASELGIDDVRADLLPGDKVQAMKDLCAAHGTVGMVGDGSNDAPALATATVGFAMGVAGTDTALETADITLMADDLRKLPFTIRLSRQARRVIGQNITLAIAIKLLAVALAFSGLLTLWLAVLADMGASILVTLNGLRLLHQQPTAPSHAHEACGCGDKCCAAH